MEYCFEDKLHGKDVVEYNKFLKQNQQNFE